MTKAKRQRKRPPSPPKAGNGEVTAPRKRGRVENLRPPIKPGEVRNPTGKNGHEWLKEFRDYFGGEPDEVLPKGVGRAKVGQRRIDLVKRALFMKAIRGGDIALKLVIEQLNGRARQAVELTGADGGPVTVENAPRTSADLRRELAELLGTKDAVEGDSEDEPEEPGEG